MSSLKQAKKTTSVAKGTNSSLREDGRPTPGFPKGVPHGTPVVAGTGGTETGRPPVASGVWGREVSLAPAREGSHTGSVTPT